LDWRDLAALSTIAAYAWGRPRRAVVSCSAAGIVLSLFVANASLKRCVLRRLASVASLASLASLASSLVSLSSPPSALCFFLSIFVVCCGVVAVLSVQAVLCVRAFLSCLVCATFVVNVAAFALH
jgi:hypothetical protein